MTVPEMPPAPADSTPPRPSMPRSWRWFLRLSGLFALLAFLTPAAFVIKFYAADRPREAARAERISLAPITPAVALDTIAPPLAPPAPGNAAAFYTQAIQSFADRRRQGGFVFFPTAREAGLILEGARRRDCRFFATDGAGRPLFAFHDPGRGGATVPYAYPRSARDTYRYLSAAGGLALAMAHIPRRAGPGAPGRRAMVGRAIVRFGDGLGREGATWAHVEVAMDIKRIGLRLLLPFGGEALRKYVYAQQAFEEAMKAKYALLASTDAGNVLLEARVARSDGDPLWRREAVWALGQTAAMPGVAWRHPMETLTAKATLADAAARDPDPSVRGAAAATLAEVAQHGAIIRR